ncbi:MAG TPA: IS66 family transposase [Planctomycetaceae bacterium]|nr:IS66 family transposase [Planctomycetaceae bacterium]
MVSTPVELPDNLPACHAIILRQAEAIERLEARIEQLNRDLASLKRQLFGSRRERFEPGHGEDAAGQAAAEASAMNRGMLVMEGRPSASELLAATAAGPTRRTSQGRQKRVLDASIPREKVLHRLDERDVPPELWNNPRAKRFFRFVREEVELQEARVRVLEHYEEVIAWEDEATGQGRLVAASAPEPLIDRCYLGVAFLAYLAASRFADHIPYYREEDILARVGFSIHRATQWRWMRGLAGIALPLVELMRERTTQSWVQGIDETPCDILCPELGRTRSAYLYAQYGDAAHPYVCFAFASHKDEENVRRIVGNYKGYLQSDAYICYELIAAASKNRIIAVGCWAHARRKFEPLIEAGPHPQAAWILGEIQKLYDIEDRARDMTDDERLVLRQAESRPIVTGIKAWLDARDQDELPKSPLRAGINYLRNRWEAFERFLEDGRIPIDNNRTEAMIKGPVMGKKAWLFFGNEHAGETAAVFYTLTMTCKRHNIDVQAYLLDVFRRIRTATPAELESLLPDRWIQNHPEARVRQRVQESHAAAARKRQRRARRRSAVPSG